MLRSLALTLAAYAAAQTLPLPGNWTLRASYLEGYTVSGSSNASIFNVVCNRGPCSAWQTAVLTVVNANTGACSIDFNSGLVHSGSIDVPYADAITWSDNSVWQRIDTNVTLQVHLVPHSHNDPGWLSTIEQLYENSIRGIYTNVVASLALNPERTFASEIVAFWNLWWNDPLVNDTMRGLAQQAVRTGQLVFFGAGWVQPDETVTRVEDQIEQMALGRMFLQSTLGYGPVTMQWAADPFGHSNTYAYLQTLYAANGMVIGRPMSAQDPINSQSALLYHPMLSFPDGGADDEHTLVYHDHVCGYWEPMRDNKAALVAGNVTQVVESLFNYINSLAMLGPPRMRTVLVMFGDDFEWGQAQVMYATLDRVLAAMSANTSLAPRVNITYSTPYRWVQALHAEQQAAPQALAFPSRPGWDTIPLMGAEFAAVWSGIDYSNEGWKMVFHEGSGVLRATQIAHAVAHDSAQWLQQFSLLLNLSQAVSLVQHHDAITGDSHIDVMADFGARVQYGIANASIVLSANQQALGGATGGIMCFNASMVACDALVNAISGNANRSATLTVHNAMAWARNEYVELLLPFSQVCAAQAGVTVPAQIAPSFTFPNLYSFVFLAQLPPLGFGAYTISTNCASSAVANSRVVRRTRDSAVAHNDVDVPWSISNGLVQLTLNSTSFKPLFLSSTDPANNSTTTLAVDGDILFYSSKAGDENLWTTVTDGGDYTTAQTYIVTELSTATQATGPLFQEIGVAYNNYGSGGTGPFQRWRVYAGERHVHVYTGTGPFAYSSNNRSQDAIVRLTTNITNNGTWYTDSNGLEFLPRVLNSRGWYTGSGPYMYPDSPVTSNQYPITAGALMSDAASGVTLALLSTTSHPVSSQTDGMLEWGVNRVVVNGGGGSIAAVNELVYVHNVLALSASFAGAGNYVRPVCTALATPVVLVASNATPQAGNDVFSAVTAPLPSNVRVLSLQLLPPGLNISSVALAERAAAVTAPTNGVLLMRLHRIYARGEDAGGDAPVQVDVASLFKPTVYTVTAVTEMTVDGAQEMDAARAARLSWSQTPGASSARAAAAAAAPPFRRVNGTIVTLLPMDIITLALSVA